MKKSDVYLIISNIFSVGVFAAKNTLGVVTCASLCLVWLIRYITQSIAEDRET